jgi:hypothetical protein
LFALGAGTFLINQILYNLYCISLWGSASAESLYRRRYLAFVIAVVIISLSSINLPTAFTTQTTKEKDRLLVILLPVYAVFLNFTAILPFVVNLAQRKFKFHLIGLIVGGISFFISDNVLGRGKLTDETILEKRMYDSMLIMGTYYLAQYFIPLSAMYGEGTEGKED